MKIVMIASSYPRYQDDNASIFLRYLAEHLYKQHVTVHVLAPADKTPGTKVENGIFIHRFQYFPARWQKLAYGSGILPNLKRNPVLWLQVPFFVISMLFSLLRLLKRIKPDVVHAHWLIPQGYIAALSKLMHKVPVIITVHGSDAFALKNKLLDKVKQYSLNHSDAWTSNTNATARAITHSCLLPKPYIIPMGVDIKQFETGHRQKLRTEPDSDGFIILFVGRLIENKGVDDLITALSLLPRNYRTKTRLWIVGNGDQRKNLELLAIHLKVQDRVTFLGTVPNKMLPDYYSAADLFVGPSVITESGAEGQGIIFLEAAAAKLCTLSTRVGGIDEVIDDGRTGVLVEPRNPKQLAENIQSLLSDDNLRKTLSANAYSKLKNSYSWEKIAAEFKDVYQQLIKRQQQ